MNQQALHGPAINQVQQQPMAHIQGAGKNQISSNIQQIFIHPILFSHTKLIIFSFATFSNCFAAVFFLFAQNQTANNANNLTKGHVKRYSNQRQRTGLETQTQPQAQAQQLPMNVVMQQQQPPQPSQQPQNPLQPNSHQTPQQNVVPNVSAPAQFQPNFFPNEYPGTNSSLNSKYCSNTSYSWFL